MYAKAKTKYKHFIKLQPTKTPLFSKQIYINQSINSLRNELGG